MKKKERTEAQKLAARINGAKSRGPVTPEGKGISSQNAVRHGLTARRVVLENERPEAWDDFLQALTEEWEPQTPAELQIVHDLAGARWRLNRLLDIETESLNVEMARERESVEKSVSNGADVTRITLAWQALQKEGTLPAIHRHETRLRRIIRECMAQLAALHEGRQNQKQQDAPPSASVNTPVQNEPEPCPPAVEGTPGEQDDHGPSSPAQSGRPRVAGPLSRQRNEPEPATNGRKCPDAPLADLDAA
jgi:hypothetical protein